MKYLYFGLALFGLSAFAWAGVTLVRDRSTDTAVHASQASAAAETPLGGPIVHGLQLRFEIKNPTEGVSSHSFRVALVNVSERHHRTQVPTVERGYRVRHAVRGRDATRCRVLIVSGNRTRFLPDHRPFR
ncbi:MAG: hypothetical protein IPF82_03855 [Blastocatellia bacterium]|nr:hypothetical protein [Blastocatellia bacterium]